MDDQSPIEHESNRRVRPNRIDHRQHRFHCCDRNDAEAMIDEVRDDVREEDQTRNQAQAPDHSRFPPRLGAAGILLGAGGSLRSNLTPLAFGLACRRASTDAAAFELCRESQAWREIARFGNQCYRRWPPIVCIVLTTPTREPASNPVRPGLPAYCETGRPCDQ